MSKKKPRICQKCGKKERIDAFGFTDFFLSLPYCLECINWYMDRLNHITNGAKK